MFLVWLFKEHAKELLWEFRQEGRDRKQKNLEDFKLNKINRYLFDKFAKTDTIQLNENGELVKSDYGRTEVLNNFFSSVVKTLKL